MPRIKQQGRTVLELWHADMGVLRAQERNLSVDSGVLGIDVGLHHKPIPFSLHLDPGRGLAACDNQNLVPGVPHLLPLFPSLEPLWIPMSMIGKLQSHHVLEMLLLIVEYFSEAEPLLETGRQYSSHHTPSLHYIFPITPWNQLM